MRNTYLKDLLPDRGFGGDPSRRECRSGETTLTTETAEEGRRLCNGDIFFITGVSQELAQRTPVVTDSVLVEPPE